jgi:hypothetical protein
MAGISEKVSPEEVLPLLAHNVTMEGYKGYGKHATPTEFLILLEGYVEQARALRALASPEGVIRIANCSDAQPLLKTIGYRLQGPCGPNSSVETADPKKAFLTIDSGFPLADLEQTLREGKPFVRSFPSTQVPVLFSQAHWTVNDKNKHDDVIDVLLSDPALARLYWALARMDHQTQAVLRQSPGLNKLVPLAPVLDFYGDYIYIRSGRVVVPGGAAAESAWRTLVGASPDSPGEFITRLLAKDEGWLAAYFDALSRVSSPRQSYFTEPRRMHRFYAALRGKDLSAGSARAAFRPDPGLLLLVTHLQFKPTGEPQLPGNLQVWKEVLGRGGDSKLVNEWAKRASGWTSPEQLVEAMFALSRVPTGGGPLRVFLTLSEMDRARSPLQRLSPQTARLLAEKFSRYSDQYVIFSEFQALDDASVTRFLDVADAIDRIPDRSVRADALGIFQANVGLWQILARQGQIPNADWNRSWQRVINPFVGILSSAQLFDVARSSFGELWRATGGKPQLSQDETVAFLAGPKQPNPQGERVRQELANRIRAILDAQRLMPLDTLFALGDGLNGVAQGKVRAETLLPLAGQIQEFEMPKPLFTSRERAEWAFGLYNDPHTLSEVQTDLTQSIKSPSSPNELAAARGQLVPFLRDTLVGLNYGYYAPPGAQMLLNNPLFVRSHDFSGEMIGGRYPAWRTPELRGRGYAASGGAHLAGSLAGLPYVLAKVEQNFIVPESVGALIWEDLAPSLLDSAVVPRWWGVTRHELHAVALHQRFGEELLAAAAENEKLRQRVMGILSDRMLPQRSERVEEALRAGHGEAALSELAPADTFYLAAEFRRRFPQEAQNWGKAGEELNKLAQRYLQEVTWERLSEDFGVPHPALEQTYARELVNVKPFPTFMGYSSRLLAECWDSNNLYWARLADESGYPPAMLNLLVPELTHLMIKKISATHLEDWPALLRALRETGEEFRQGKVAPLPSGSTASTL